MRKRGIPEDEPSFFGRIMAALLAFTLASLTVFFLPLILLWQFPVKGLFLGVPLLPLSSIFYIGVLFVGINALWMGYQLGFCETLDVMNLLWKTGESHDPDVIAAAESLRKRILLSGVITSILLCLWWWALH